ncbi:butyrophilin subfamily 1 member A1-like isoform X5 [Meles meles]|uniref:butyrophilin subfamily 1 member A1-like isoform X5 n=1 Tax=Meles meles TaxID=9662 RepID=UPI001E69AC1E|nr:butyrophilin subfamily 1 member A1-like isoform X5 [Meles meles]
MMKAVSFSYMAFIMLRFFLVVHFKFQNTVMKNMHEFHLEDLIITNALLHLGFFFIIIFLWLDYHNHEKRKKEEQGEPWKENGELRGKNDQRRAQFRNDWQNASLYPDWRKEFFQAANVILDPATAHPALILSEENRCVSCGKKPQDLPKDPQRFNSLPCVLGHPVITSGRCYWEVDIRDSGAWDLGICRNNVMRQGRICIKPEDGFWAIRFYKDEYWALTSPEMQLTVREHPARMCIFLEYEDGRISFYNMTDKSHIHTFSQGSFNGSVRPFFRLWLNDSKHLTICPVPEA